MSAVQGLWKDSQDFLNCLLYMEGVHCLTVSIKQGSTVKDNGEEELHYINTDTRADR